MSTPAGNYSITNIEEIDTSILEIKARTYKIKQYMAATRIQSMEYSSVEFLLGNVEKAEHEIKALKVLLETKLAIENAQKKR